MNTYLLISGSVFLSFGIFLFFGYSLMKITRQPSEFELLFDEITRWQEKQFGSRLTRSANGPLRHLIKEANEAIQAEHSEKRIEIIDCLFLVFDALRCQGVNYTMMCHLLSVKLEENMIRQWSKPTSDQPIEHIRSESIAAEVEAKKTRSKDGHVVFDSKRDSQKDK